MGWAKSLAQSYQKIAFFIAFFLLKKHGNFSFNPSGSLLLLKQKKPATVDYRWSQRQLTNVMVIPVIVVQLRPTSYYSSITLPQQIPNFNFFTQILDSNQWRRISRRFLHAFNVKKQVMQILTRLHLCIFLPFF